MRAVQVRVAPAGTLTAAARRAKLRQLEEDVARGVRSVQPAPAAAAGALTSAAARRAKLRRLEEDLARREEAQSTQPPSVPSSTDGSDMH